ncbi:MAG: hypothetical protein HQL64_05670 [Magnetococcales bacterium]|nr:hypothetical protein [Magnetococcales bacterium]
MNRRNFLSQLVRWCGMAYGITLLPGCATSRGLFPQGVRQFAGDVRFDDQPVHKGDMPRRDGLITTGPSSSLVLVLGEDALLIRENSTIQLTSRPATQPEIVSGTDIDRQPLITQAHPFGRKPGGFQLISSAEAGPQESASGSQGAGTRPGKPDSGQQIRPAASVTPDVHRIIGFTLKRGAALSVFAEGPHLIKTPVATIGIHGTGLYLEHAADASYVCVCYGQVTLNSIQDPNARESFTTRHHESPRTIHKPDSNHPVIEQAKMLNHTDDELVMLENLVGRSPPFADPSKITQSRHRY